MTQIYVDKAIQALRDLHRETLQVDLSQLSLREFLTRQADSILKGHRQGNDAVTFHLGCWCPQFIGLQPEQIMNTAVSLDDARLTIAREYGYADWAAVEALGEQKFDTVFEQAADWVVTGQVDALTKLLESNPNLARQPSQHPHNATLLHYLAANGIESHRQVTPLNAIDVAQCLLQGGADINAQANMYGGGSTALGLWLSSAHPANAGVRDEVAEYLTLNGAT